MTAAIRMSRRTASLTFFTSVGVKIRGGFESTLGWVRGADGLSTMSFSEWRYLKKVLRELIFRLMLFEV